MRKRDASRCLKEEGNTEASLGKKEKMIKKLFVIIDLKNR